MEYSNTFEICRTVLAKTVSLEGMRKQVWKEAEFLLAGWSLKSWM